MPDVLLVTAADMPKADPESSLLVDALAVRGVHAELVPWDGERDWAAAAMVVCRTPWDYFLRCAEFLAWARSAAAVTRFENPVELVAWNSHKGYLLDLERAGVPIVPTALVGPGTTFDGEVVVKPAISGGALGALRTSDPHEAAAHAASLDGDVLVQPYLASVADGEVSIVLFDGVLSHAVRKQPAPGEYRVQDHHGGTVHAHQPTAAELAVAEATLAASPAPTAYARIDLVRGDDGPLVMEAELIEPELFLPLAPESAGRFADALVRRL